jgi:carbamoyl-phosphate synthase small subunit
MTAEKIINMKLDGLIISNGPEEDDAIIGVVKTVEQLLGKIPIMGISTGHEIIGLAIGGRLKKMRVGHHGVNYPVKAPDLYKGDITVQNHSFIVDENSIKNKGDVIISKRNINDDSIEEMKSKKLKFISIQYYPASPGFEEVNEAFKEFLSMAANYKEVEYAKT